MIDTAEIRQLRANFVADLIAADASLSADWRPAFERVPRHSFVPRVYRQDGQVVDSSTPDAWLALVYSDRALVTLTDDNGVALSSSSSPGVMWEMLDGLQVRPGQRVLEIGTGTGYNAALLCDRLGSENVTTVEIDSQLAEAARQRLTRLGYQPTAVVGDGAHGYEPNAPYDRVLATCAVRRVPVAWIAQTRPGGIVCAMLPYGMVVLRVHESGAATGRFHPTHFTFMEMRRPGSPTDTTPVSELFALARGDGDERSTSVVSAGMPLRSALWMLVLIVELPELAVLELGGGAFGFVDPESRSWARVEGSKVVEGGPRRVWAIVESICDRWQRAGAPERTDIGLTVTPDGGQRLWLRSAHSDAAWTL